MITIGARKSPLARAQAEHIADRLRADGAEVEIVGIVTTGDVDTRALTSIGGTGIFAAQVRQDLLDGRIDVAVHSLKDLPTLQPDGLEIAATPIREDVRDVLVGTRLDELRTGMRIGTGSPRRQVQLQAWAAARGLDVEVVAIRGNVDTRLARVAPGDLDAVVLAAAGLRRLGRVRADADGEDDADVENDHDAGGRGWQVAGLIADPIPTTIMLPAAGQGALAVEISAEATDSVRAAVAALDDAGTRATTSSERVFLAAIEAGCLAPVGVLGRISGSDLTLSAVIGRTVVDNDERSAAAPWQMTATGSRADAPLVGRQLADQALATMRDAQG